MTYAGHSDQHYGHTTYSQHGEDLLIVNMFKIWGIEKPTYLDIGAHHPLHCSNTALLYERGSEGVNVEANIRLMEEFKAARPYDHNICIGVAHISGTMDFFMYDPKSGRNTFSKEEQASYGQLVRYYERLICVTINKIVEERLSGIWPDFLSVDAEGLDFSIIQSAEFTQANRPKLICAEVRDYATESFNNMLHEKGYTPIVRMGENILYRSSERHLTRRYSDET